MCSSANVELVKSLGADRVIDYTKEDFTRSGDKYDVIYDTVGKSSFGRCKRALAPHGKYMSPILGFGLLCRMLWTSWFRTQEGDVRRHRAQARDRAASLPRRTQRRWSRRVSCDW